MIFYDKEKIKGFRGFKYIAKTYIDEKGEYINNDTKEGVDMIEIICDTISTDKESVILKRLQKEITNKINEYKPIWQK